MTDAADSPPHRRWWLRIFTTFLALLLLYVLSIGPVVGYNSYRWTTRGAEEPSPLNRMGVILYTPLVSLAEGTALEEPLSAYVYWWDDLMFRLTGTERPTASHGEL